MKLSVCIIARNEEHNLARAIGSFAGLADEFVVLDTGSTDGTIALAKGLGAQVFEWPWRDDFGAARNEAISHASGEWVFLLDADEELLPGQEAALRAIMDDPSVQGAFILREDLFDAYDLTRFAEIWQLRLFRREILPPFVGVCHPSLQPPLDNAIYSTLRFRHYGYVGGLMRSKLERGRKLVERELELRPGQLYYLAELVRVKYELGEPIEADLDLAWNQFLVESRRGLIHNNAQHLVEIALATGKKSREECEEIVAKCLPNALPLHWLLARRAFEKADFAAAVRHLETFDKLVQDDSYDRSLGFDPVILERDYLVNLGVAYAQVGEFGRARATFERIVADPKWGEIAARNLEALSALDSN